MTATAYVALGSNLGDRDAHLAFALRELESLEGTEVVECSAVYETEPVGPEGQGPYLNAVASLRTGLEPGPLLRAMVAIEARAGRPGNRSAEARWQARTLDLDLLFYERRQIDEPGLVVPHPRLHERSFVLVPLAEIAPDFVHPTLGVSTSSLLARLGGPSGVRPWERCLRICR